jgi:DNA-binding MarR family transcriptional regulator
MDNSLGYRINDLARLIRKRFDEESRDLGVTNSQWRVLVNVLRQPGINQGTLADLMEVEPITTCRMVDRMEMAGLVERRRDPNDRRAWQIHLTEAAMPLTDKLKERAAGLNAVALAGLGEQDQAELVRMLDLIRLNLSGNASDLGRVQHG